MVAIALDVGNPNAAMDAPNLQPIIGEILNFSQPFSPSSVLPVIAQQGDQLNEYMKSMPERGAVAWTISGECGFV